MKHYFLLPLLFVGLTSFAAAQAPTLTTDLIVSQSLNTGSTAVFTAVFSGTPAPTYVWTVNGTVVNNTSGSTDVISGASGNQLVITNATAVSNGSYTVTATNTGGSTSSSASALAVAVSSSPGYLISISARAFVGTGENILIGGFYIVGTTSRTVLIQGIGPALTAKGVSDALPDPELALHAKVNGVDTVLYSNTGWSTNTNSVQQQVLLNAAATAFATPVFTQGSGDSELLLTLPPGPYTAEVGGASGDTGVALCAIYQLN
jgi:hypothetical protein